MNERVTLSTPEGPMHAFVASQDAGDGRSEIVVFQEAFGVNAHIRDVTERCARLGTVAIAPELFHRTSPGFEAPYGDLQAVRPQIGALTTEGIAADAHAAFEWLCGRVDPDRIAAIGFCMGGRAAYIANAHLPLRAAVSFYGGGIAPDLLGSAAQQYAPILMFWGGLDTHIPPEQHRAVADALTAAGKTHEQVFFSQAGHGFFCDQRDAFHPGAAAQAWALVQAFLADCGVIAR
jgi:carboxymethylenebutenolidase